MADSKHVLTPTKDPAKRNYKKRVRVPAGKGFFKEFTLHEEKTQHLLLSVSPTVGVAVDVHILDYDKYREYKEKEMDLLTDIYGFLNVTELSNESLLLTKGEYLLNLGNVHSDQDIEVDVELKFAPE